MKQAALAPLFAMPFAAQAQTNTITQIPQTSPGTGRASMALGFPASCMTPLAAGGNPPYGQDLNGILNMLSTAAQAAELGMLRPFSASYAAAVGGYPAGATVAHPTITGRYILCTQDGNSNDPSQSMAGWLDPLAGFQPAGNYATIPQLETGYRLLNQQVWTAGGSYTYTPTAGARAIIVRLCGAGGGGASANANGSGYVTLGLGGCGGTYAETGILPAPTSPVSVIVGSGGAGGATAGYGGSASCYGFNGGVSSFGSVITCPGGPGAPAPTNFASAPNSGTATVFTPAATGTIAWQSVGGAPLGWCSFGIINTYGSFVFGSPGGSSLFGSGGAWGNAGNGFNAVNPGAGGGAATSNPGAGGTGGNGADGIVIIEEYC